ncbi:MAG: hypothetical protein JO296_16365 [Pseudonocardiales bacterium]|nr:hypothetical protein [Pseudonocardiales bacterium]
MTGPRTRGVRGPDESVSRQLARTQRTADPPPSDVAARLRRRRATSRRCSPLPDGRRDPLDPAHTHNWSSRELESWRNAWWHLHRLGLPASVPPRVIAAGQARHDGAA